MLFFFEVLINTLVKCILDTVIHGLVSEMVTVIEGWSLVRARGSDRGTRVIYFLSFLYSFVNDLSLNLVIFGRW